METSLAQGTSKSETARANLVMTGDGQIFVGLPGVLPAVEMSVTETTRVSPSSMWRNSSSAVYSQLRTRLGTISLVRRSVSE